MKSLRTILIIIFWVVSIVSNQALAQGSFYELDAKNGFRDAKLGAPLSSFSDMRLTNYKDILGYATIYERVNDNKRLGNVPLNRIDYYFYKGRLCSITLIADAKYFGDVLHTLHTAYGDALIPGGFSMKGEIDYHWYGKKAMLYCKTFRIPGQSGRFLEASFESVPIYDIISIDQQKQRLRNSNGL